MEYKNALQKDEIYYYPNESFNTIIIRLNFLADNDNNKAPIYDLLCDFIERSNQQYQVDDEIERKRQNAYNLRLNFNSDYFGNQKIISLYVNMVSPNVIHDDYSKEAFEFIRDIVKKPDFTDQEVLDQVKREYLSKVRLNLSKHSIYVYCMYNSMVLPDENREYDDAYDIDYITKVIQSVTLEDLERIYHEIMNHFYNGLVFGNISEEQFHSFTDCISLTPKKQDTHYYRNISSVEGDIEIEKDMKQSFIYVTYDVERLSYSQLLVLHYILNSSFVGLCFKILREKYGLVYHAQANISYFDDKLYIQAEVDKNKKEKFLQALDEIICDLNNPDLLEEYVARAKEEYFMNDYTFDENANQIVNSINAYLLGCQEHLDKNEIDDEIRNLNSDDLLQKVKTLKRKNVFMVRGVNNESV